MRRESNGTLLSAVFVDYDNIYLSLRRKSEEAAKRFSKDAALWLRELESGRLMTPTNGPSEDVRRRMVMNRCYGNPVPRRSGHDNSTDMNSFPFVRHHFLRGGFEVVDCPPLTAQLKNSSDIRIVMDVRDFLTHETYFDEFIILSGDADFTPVLHRLRAHARRTVIFANDYTATPYTAICDGEVRESDLIRLLVDGELAVNGVPALAANSDLVAARGEILSEVAAHVRAAGQPVPLEMLAERAVRTLGHERTAGSGWAGAGSFRELLVDGLPDGIRITDDPPYLAYVADLKPQPAVLTQREARPEAAPIARREPVTRNPAAPVAEQRAPLSQNAGRGLGPSGYAAPAPGGAGSRPRAPMLETQPAVQLNDGAQDYEPEVNGRGQYAATPVVAPRSPYTNPPAAQPPLGHAAPVTPQPAPQQRVIAPTGPAKANRAPSNTAAALQQSVTRIYEACQAPPLSPPDYRRLFEAMAAEITENGLQGSQTLANIQARVLAAGTQVQRDDVRFVLDVVGEPDPWFEQGASANLFAGRFRNFVVARCRTQGLSLSVEELDLIEAWFTGAPETFATARSQIETRQQQPQPKAQAPADAWWNDPSSQDPRQAGAGQGSSGVGAAGVSASGQDEEFPRIVRSRLRG